MSTLRIFSVKSALISGALASLAALLVVTGCAGAGRPAAEAAAGGKSGSQLWSESCGRCHNVRSPVVYSDAQWAIVMQHMRVAANLTGEDARKIEQFLKAAN